MNKSEIKELVKLCSYPELQKLWRPKVGDFVCANTVAYPQVFGFVSFYSDESQTINIVTFDSIRFESIGRKKVIWLPRIEDVIEILGSRIWKLSKVPIPKLRENIRFAVLGEGEFYDKSARIACLSALKATLKGGK